MRKFRFLCLNGVYSLKKVEEVRVILLDDIVKTL